jgi:hypothetical protein
MNRTNSPNINAPPVTRADSSLDSSPRDFNTVNTEHSVFDRELDTHS